MRQSGPDSVSGDVRVDEARSSEREHGLGDFEGVLGNDMDEPFVKNVSGDVKIEVPAGTGGSVEAKTVSGSITDSKGTLNITKASGRRQASGPLGTGSTAIEVEAVSGDVSFR